MTVMSGLSGTLSGISGVRLPGRGIVSIFAKRGTEQEASVKRVMETMKSKVLQSVNQEARRSKYGCFLKEQIRSHTSPIASKPIKPDPYMKAPTPEEEDQLNHNTPRSNRSKNRRPSDKKNYREKLKSRESWENIDPMFRIDCDNSIESLSSRHHTQMMRYTQDL